MTSKARTTKPAAQPTPTSPPVEQVNEMLQTQNLQLNRELKTFRVRTQKLTDEVTNLEFEKVVLEEKVELLESQLKAFQATKPPEPQTGGPQPVSQATSMPPPPDSEHQQ